MRCTGWGFRWRSIPASELHVISKEWYEMAIDICNYTFADLAMRILPMHMERMRQAIENPYPMKLFGTKGIGPKAILQDLGRPTDFTGCYVLLEQTEPIYVGISRTIVQRLIQHVKGKTHYDASLKD